MPQIPRPPAQLVGLQVFSLNHTAHFKFEPLEGADHIVA